MEKTRSINFDTVKLNKTSFQMNEVDLEGDGDGYSGTFRWKKTKKFKSIPVCDNDVDLNGGWMEYLISRFSNIDEGLSFVKEVHSDLSIIDCLSSAVTIGKACLSLGMVDTSVDFNDILSIVCIGTSTKAEGRIANETNCFNELQYILPNVKCIDLYLVGPEMNTSEFHEMSKKMRFKCYQGTSLSFFRENIKLLSSKTIVVGLNCGFGNFENPQKVRYSLLQSWLPDLYFLTATKLPLIFTCANDYADLSGETTVMQKIMGAYFLAEPQSNPFEFASTLISPPATSPHDKSHTREGYARGNSFWYAVQGHDKSRRVKIPDGDTRSLVLALTSSSLVPFTGAICRPFSPWGAITSTSNISTPGSNDSMSTASSPALNTPVASHHAGVTEAYMPFTSQGGANQHVPPDGTSGNGSNSNEGYKVNSTACISSATIKSSLSTKNVQEETAIPKDQALPYDAKDDTKLSAPAAALDSVQWFESNTISANVCIEYNAVPLPAAPSSNTSPTREGAFAVVLAVCVCFHESMFQFKDNAIDLGIRCTNSDNQFYGSVLVLSVNSRQYNICLNQVHIPSYINMSMKRLDVDRIRAKYHKKKKSIEVYIQTLQNIDDN